MIPRKKIFTLGTIAIISVLLFGSSRCRAKAGTGESVVILLTEERGLLISKNRGKKWKSFNEGLPDGMIPLKIKSDPGNNLYLLTLNSGIYKMESGDDRWRSINSPLFLSRAPGNGTGEYRKISAFSINPDNPEQIVLATKYSVYISNNGGKEWLALPTEGIEKFYYITSLAITGKEPLIYAGTSYKGLYRGVNGKFQKFSSGLPVDKYSTSTYFHEELTEIFAPGPGHRIFAGFAFGKGVYSSDGNDWKKVPLPELKDDNNFIHSLSYGGSKLYVSTDNGIFFSDPSWKSWEKYDIGMSEKNIPGDTGSLALFIRDGSGEVPDLYYHLSDYSKKLTVRAGSIDRDRRAVYTSANSARSRINALIKLIKDTGLNSIVIDMKDDFGYLYFPTTGKTASEIGSNRYPINVRGIIGALRENGIYSIARVVVFKDRFLFSAYNGKYAIWNSRTNSPWQGNTREHWVDPHSPFVRDYNIEIARELEALGFDEIQFDYIRFPTDGPTHLCSYRYREKADIYKSEVLTQFLRDAKSRLKIPVSVDIYGFNAWYKCGNWMGQDIEEFSSVIDIICPMDYPSHFGNQFLMDGPRNMHPYRILYSAGKRANRHANGRSLIRPYLQAFNLLSPTWSPEYILNQVRGAEKGDCSGYTFWNAKTDYDMVRRALMLQ